MLAIHQNGTSTISTKTTRPTTVTTRAVHDLPSGRLRRAPAPDGRPENPRAHWICRRAPAQGSGARRSAREPRVLIGFCRRGACAGLRRPTVGQRTRVLIGFAVGAPAQGSGARRSARDPRAHWICRRGACAGLRRPTVGQRTRVLIGFAVGAPAQGSGARRFGQRTRVLIPGLSAGSG